MILLEICCFLLFAYFLVVHFKKQNKAQNIPPGPFRWPILGNSILLNRMSPKYPHKALAKLSESYGNVMSIGMGVHYGVVVSSYEGIKDIFKRNEASISRFEFPFVSDRSFGKNLGVIWSHGTVWKEVRRFTMRTLRDFGFGRTAQMKSIMEEEMKDFCNYVKSSVEKDGILPVSSLRFALSAINILWSAVGGYRFNSEDERLHNLLICNDKMGVAMGYDTIYNPFPFLKDWFPVWSQNAAHKEINREVQDSLREIIASVRKSRGEKANSFIEAFLDQIDKDKEAIAAGGGTGYYTEEQLIVILMDLFFAGSETTSTTVQWALVYLVLNPRVQEKFRSEVKALLEEQGSISAADSPKLPYVNATISEIFRVSNFVPLPGARKAETDFIYDNFVIPKGSILLANMDSVFHDKKFWGDPEVFRPERFLGKDNKLINTERIINFGIGKRICLGETLARDSVFMYLTTLFRNFAFEGIPGQEPKADNPLPAIALCPQPFLVKVTVLD